jgi:outer membrane protein OmpA-like peptidoglycan-associated protein
MVTPLKALTVLLAWLLAAVAAALADDTGAKTGFVREIGFTTLQPPAIDLLRPARHGERFEFIPIHPVRFEFDDDTLSDGARWILDDTALLIRHLPGVTRVIVKGFTDVVAGEVYNDGLSDRRAAAVRDYLIERGVAVRMLHVTGYGMSNPVDEEWTREGRARNRRVEIYIVREQIADNW